MEAIDGLLNQVAQVRSQVLPATGAITSCTDTNAIAQAVQALRQVAATRNSLLSQLSQLPIEQIPNGSQLLANLQTAWMKSAESDQSYAAWGSDIQNGGGCGTADANYRNAQMTDVQALAAKQAFVAAWNPLATEFHLSQSDPARL